MLHPNPDMRPSAAQLLSTILQSPKEIELKQLRLENTNLKDKVSRLENLLKSLGYTNFDEVDMSTQSD